MRIKANKEELRECLRNAVARIIAESGHEGWREEDWNPNHPDYRGREEEDETDEPEDFDERYYEKRKNK